MSNSLYGKPLADWNRLAGLSGAGAADIEVTAHGHKCGANRMSVDGTPESYAHVDFAAMSAAQRLMWTFDIYAPCCWSKSPRGSRRTVRDVMRDKAISEAASVRVGGDTPRRMLRELRPRVGWE